MLSPLRPHHPVLISIGRVILAVMMVLVLLSGVAPPGSFASSHECNMACCAGKPSHMAGSCSAAFATNEESESSDEQAEESSGGHSHHHAGSSSKPAYPISDETANHHPARHYNSKDDDSSPRLVAGAVAITMPCSAECAAAAVAPTQLRRPREAAVMSVVGKSRPPARVVIKTAISNVVRPSSERRRQIRPRAPPAFLINLST